MKAEDISPTFCILPWIHLATYTNGDVSTCCIAPQMRDLNLNHLSIAQAWNSEHFKETRLKMLSGKPVERCSYCYQQEKSNLPSHRTDENNIWFQRLSSDQIKQLIKQTGKDGSLEPRPTTLDLRPGNSCNLKCIICSPVESSSWYKDAETLSTCLQTEAIYDWKFKTKASKANYSWFGLDRISAELNDLIPNLTHVIFGGGEPLLLKEHDQFIEQAISTGKAQNIELRYHTNGTQLKEHHLEKWSHFKHVQIMISIDGLEEVNNYLRYPSNWENYQRCLKLIDQSPDNIEPQILSTISLLNLPYISEFSDWITAQKFKKIGYPHHHGLFHPGILFWPKYLAVTVLPKNIKEEVSTTIRSYIAQSNNPQAQRFQNIIEHMNSNDDSRLLPQAIDYLTELDKLRGTNFRETFPHLADL